MKPMLRLATFWTVVVLGARPLHGAFFEGRAVNIGRVTGATPTNLIAIVSQDVVVGPGVEIVGFGAFQLPPIDLPGFVDVDLSDTRLSFTVSNNQQPAGYEELRVDDVYHQVPPIFGVSLDASTNWTGFSSSRVIVSENSIILNLSQLPVVAGQRIVLNVVPEPAGAALAATALVLLALRRRAED